MLIQIQLLKIPAATKGKTMRPRTRGADARELLGGERGKKERLKWPKPPEAFWFSRFGDDEKDEPRNSETEN